ncbi:cytochrome b561 domain-containing protein 2 [Sigmodon hispidus]
MALSVETESHIYRALRTASGAAAHLVALGFTIFVAVLARPGSSLFSWHPVLMSLAFSFLMTEALLMFSPESSLLRSLSRKVRARCHWVLQLLALLCALLGLGLVILHKEQLGKAHLATRHGQAGLLAVLWAGLQCSGGMGLLYPKLLPRWPLAKLKLYHATSGLVGYLLGSASLLLGMCSLWFTATVTGGAWYLAALCPVLTSLVIMNQGITRDSGQLGEGRNPLYGGPSPRPRILRALLLTSCDTQWTKVFPVTVLESGDQLHQWETEMEEDCFHRCHAQGMA